MTTITALSPISVTQQTLPVGTEVDFTVNFVEPPVPALGSTDIAADFTAPGSGTYLYFLALGTPGNAELAYLANGLNAVQENALAEVLTEFQHQGYIIGGNGTLDMNPNPTTQITVPAPGESVTFGVEAEDSTPDIGGNPAAAQQLSFTLEVGPQSTWTPSPASAHFNEYDTTTNVAVSADGVAYVGPVAALQWEYIDLSPDSLNIVANTGNVFIKSGAGNDALNVQAVSGRNVLDGGTGSNFMVGSASAGSQDTFFVDDRAATADIWTTIANVHMGDDATIWGITKAGSQLNWSDGQGAAGYTGLTLHATTAGKPTASLTLAGYTSADLNNGRLAVNFGTTSDGSAYMQVLVNR